MTRSDQRFGDLKTPTRQSFAKNLAVLTAGEFVGRVVTAVAFIHLARVLNPSIYGSVELTLAIMLFLTLVVDQGFGTWGAREVARDPTQVEHLVSRILSAQLIAALATILLLFLVVSLASFDTTFAMLLLGYAVTLLVYPFLLSWVFQGRDQMVWVAVPLTVRQAVFAVVVLVLIREPEQVQLLPPVEIASIIIAAAVSLVVYRSSGERVAVSWRAGWNRQHFAEALPIGGSQMIWALRMYLPTILIGIIVGQAAVGLYGAAHRVVMALQTMLEVYFKNLFPSLSRAAQGSADQLASLLRRSMLLLMLPSVALAVVITLIAPKIIGLIYGEGYLQRDAVSVLALLIWMIPILAWRRHGRNALIVMNRQREELTISLIGVALSLALIFPLTLQYRAVGTSLSMIISELTTSALAWWRARRHLNNPAWLAELTATRSSKASIGRQAPLPVNTNRKEREVEPKPIFIVGAPRSGTSLLRVLLNRHPSIAICDETYYFYYVYERRAVFGDIRETSARRHLVSQYLATNRINRLGLDMDTLSNTLMEEGVGYDAFFLSLLRFYAESHEGTRYGEKTPHHVQYVHLLQEWFPECNIIHIVRDPRDVVASLLRMPWASKNLLANARTWLNCNTLSGRRLNLEGNYMLVHYENLVEEPESVLKKIFSFLGETYTQSVLEASPSAASDKWWFQRALEPISKDRLGLWQQQLTRRQVALIEGVVGPMMEEYGYQRTGFGAPVSSRIFALAEAYFSAILGKLSNLPRIWYYWIQPTHLANEETWIDVHK